MHAGTTSKNKQLLCSFLVLFFLQVHCGTLLIEVQFHSVSADLSQKFHLLLLYVIASSVPFLTIYLTVCCVAIISVFYGYLRSIKYTLRYFITNKTSPLDLMIFKSLFRYVFRTQSNILEVALFK